jgi:hypothetical protein
LAVGADELLGGRLALTGWGGGRRRRALGRRARGGDQSGSVPD